MKYEYQQPHWRAKNITDTAAAKHSIIPFAAIFPFFFPLHLYTECPCRYHSSRFPLHIIGSDLQWWLLSWLSLGDCGLTVLIGNEAAMRTKCGESEGKGGGGVDWHLQLNNWVSLRHCSSLFTVRLFCRAPLSDPSFSLSLSTPFILLYRLYCSKEMSV